MNSAVESLAVVTGMLMLHAPDGHEVFVNPVEITMLHQKLGQGKGHYTPEAACLINTSDGKFVTVVENCMKVLDAIRAGK